MAWVRIDDGFMENAKVLAISPLALRLYLAGLCWAARNETDGRIPRQALAVLRGKRAHAGELEEARLWDQDAAGWQIHDYLQYNPSAADIAERRRIRAQAGQRGGRARAVAKAKQGASDLLDAGLPVATDMDQANVNPRPHPLPQRSVVKDPSFSPDPPTAKRGRAARADARPPEVSEATRQKLVDKWAARFDGEEDVRTEVERAMNSKAVLGVISVERYLDGWLRREIEKYRPQRNGNNAANRRGAGPQRTASIFE